MAPDAAFVCCLALVDAGFCPYKSLILLVNREIFFLELLGQ